MFFNNSIIDFYLGILGVVKGSAPEFKVASFPSLKRAGLFQQQTFPYTGLKKKEKEYIKILHMTKWLYIPYNYFLSLLFSADNILMRWLNSVFNYSCYSNLAIGTIFKSALIFLLFILVSRGFWFLECGEGLHLCCLSNPQTI